MLHFALLGLRDTGFGEIYPQDCRDIADLNDLGTRQVVIPLGGLIP